MNELCLRKPIKSASPNSGLPAMIVSTIMGAAFLVIGATPSDAKHSTKDEFVPESTNNSLNIHGTGYASPNGNHPLVKVLALEKLLSTGDTVRLDSTLTNSLGDYTLNLIMTGTNDNYTNTQPGIKTFGNPFFNQAKLVVSALNSENYTINVVDASGKLIFSKNENLTGGDNELVLSGLKIKGLKIIQVTNGKETYTAKLIQGESTDFSPNISVKNTDLPTESKLKYSPLEANNIILKFIPQETGYTGTDTIISLGDHTINYILQQTPYLFTTTLKPFLETGEPVTNISPGFTTTVQWLNHNGNVTETNTYPVVNNEINIQKEIYPLDGNLGNILINNDTTTYVVNGVANRVLNWALIRQPQQKTNRPNVAQNETSAVALIPDYETQVSLDSLDGKTLHYYTIRSKAETQPGQFQSMNSGISITLIGSSGGGFGAGTFIDLAPYGVADSLDLVQKGYNESNGQPMSQEQLDRAMNIFMQAVQTRYLQNGDTLLPPHRIYTISSTADPRWLALIERGFENCIRTTYYNGTPENGREWSSTYTYNGKPRLKTTAARYNISNGDATMFEEDFSAVTGEEEGSGGLSSYVWNATTNLPSQYAYSISAVPALLNLGTGQNLKNGVVKPKELFSNDPGN